MRLTICAALAASCLLQTPLAGQAGRTPRTPRLALKALDGKTVRLADLKGRVVVLDFWASWCGPCKATFPALNTLAAQLAGQGVEVLAVSEDEKRKDLDRFVEGSALSLRVLIDARGDAARAFGVQAIPSMFVIDREGTVRFAHPNYSAAVIDSVKTEIASLQAAASLTPITASPAGS